MIKVSVKNNVNGREFGGTFETQAEADAWVAKQRAKTSWGLPERTLRLSTDQSAEDVPAEALSQQEVEIAPAVMELQNKLDEEGNTVMETVVVRETQTDPDTGEEIEVDVTREVVVMEEVETEPAVTLFEYVMPCEYDVTVVDITNEYNAITAENAFAGLRADRDAHLTATDFTQLADAPMDSATKADYRAYRDFLRTLPSTHDDTTVLSASVPSYDEWKAS